MDRYDSLLSTIVALRICNHLLLRNATKIANYCTYTQTQSAVGKRSLHRFNDGVLALNTHGLRSAEETSSIAIKKRSRQAISDLLSYRMNNRSKISGLQHRYLPFSKSYLEEQSQRKLCANNNNCRIPDIQYLPPQKHVNNGQAIRSLKMTRSEDIIKSRTGSGRHKVLFYYFPLCIGRKMAYYR